jgi:nitrate reductase assembly molybdenum cofactor insertion protein NarJ
VTYDELAGELRYPAEPAMQELYIQTFEFNPAATLELGWHLFGENYERGEFLVRMREQLRRHGVEETAELPDHLTHLLPLLARMEAQEGAHLAGEFILPALDKIQLPDENPYRAVIERIRERLRADFPDAPRRRVELPVFQEVLSE